LRRELAEVREQQAATGEILRVIASSPTELQPVLDTLIANAARLSGAARGHVRQFDGEFYRVVAHYGETPEMIATLRANPLPPSPELPAARALFERKSVHILDVQLETGPHLALTRQMGTRTLLAVPLLREDTPIGSLTIWRDFVEPFTDRQIDLVKTFADQAVIAIENVRLFTELQEKNGALTQAHAQVSEALEQQTATAEILRIISSSPTDTQPVFDTIVSSAVRLCDGLFSALYKFDGELIHFVAQHNYTPEALVAAHRVFPARPTRALFTGRTIRERAVVHIPDVELDPEHQHQALRRAIGWRSGLFVPMLREGAPIGVIEVARAEPGPFSDNEIELLKTFADQAVIAVENVRLFTELQATNRELTTALDQQTATSDILRVISLSQTDVQPVFDAILNSAVRLLGGYTGALTRVAGDQVELGALTSTDAAGDTSLLTLFPQSVHSETPHALVIRDRAPLNIADAHTDPRVPEAVRAAARIRGYRSQVVVPLLRPDGAVGTISVTRREAGGFTDDEVALLKTFADQAVIAIENVRLFTELEGRNRDLTATSEILRVISSSPTDVQPVFETIVRSAVRLCDGLFSAVFQFDGELLHQVAHHNYPPEALEELHRTYPSRPTRALLTGRAILERALVHIPDIELDPEWQHQALSRAVGFRSGLWVPMLREGAPIGVIAVARAGAGPFLDSEIVLMKTFADQAVIAIENVRLFKELEARTGELTQSVEKLTALGEVSRAVSSTLDVETVLDTIVSRASQLAGAAGCSI
jgi:GAF domain-containing protein